MVSLIGIGEELGLPSFKNNKQNFETRLLDKIEEKLKEKNEVYQINTFSYMFNKSWHINYILKNNLNLIELEKLRRIGNRFAKKESIMMNIFSPKIKYEKMPNKNISELITNENVILYDIGMNDFMYYSNQNVVASHILKKQNKKAKDILENDEIFNRVLNDVKENIDNILKINNNSSIYIMGFSLKVYVPHFIYNLYKNKKTYNYLNKYIDKWNNLLKSLENNNVHFVDLSPYNNKEEALKDIPNYIKIGKSSNNILKGSLGLQGFINDMKKDEHLNERETQIKYLEFIKNN